MLLSMYFHTFKYFINKINYSQGLFRINVSLKKEDTCIIQMWKLLFSGNTIAQIEGNEMQENEQWLIEVWFQIV